MLGNKINSLQFQSIERIIDEFSYKELRKLNNHISKIMRDKYESSLKHKLHACVKVAFPHYDISIVYFNINHYIIIFSNNEITSKFECTNHSNGHGVQIYQYDTDSDVWRYKDKTSYTTLVKCITNYENLDVWNEEDANNYIKQHSPTI